MSRKDWDEYYLDIAHAVAARADCTRRQVGAVIVNADHRQIGQGYNGAPPGEPGCLTAGACPRGRFGSDVVPPGSSYDTGPGSCISVHAEVNALLDAGGRAACLGATLYVTDAPCDGCARIVRAAGIARVVTPQTLEVSPS
ncbi:dCMP deaminase [Micromonospora sp. A200]|uniref:deoxycytidylate deaminase n=1 Tax=Micromonospora sp. A200 TaxID=2940568 RepID=UPI002474C1B8|nr:deaminase [Micromonospora sp. A200]MDH6462047.1 dCMP deaminase [Micromonospora sp. A200]